MTDLTLRVSGSSRRVGLMLCRMRNVPFCLCCSTASASSRLIIPAYLYRVARKTPRTLSVLLITLRIITAVTKLSLSEKLYKVSINMLNASAASCMHAFHEGFYGYVACHTDCINKSFLPRVPVAHLRHTLFGHRFRRYRFI